MQQLTTATYAAALTLCAISIFYVSLVSGQRASAASVPDAPTNLTLSANATSITLHWNSPASDGGSPITGYKIDHFASESVPAKDPNTSAFQWGPVLLADTKSTSTSFVDSRVVATCYYYYRVFAINAGGTSLPSNAASTHFVSMYGTISDATNSCGISAFDLAVDSSGNFALASDFNVLVFDKNGVFQNKVQPLVDGHGYFGRATGVTFDKSGNLYVADAFNAHVYKVDATGKLLNSFGSRGTGAGQFQSPIDVTLDNAGNFYVLDGSPNTIGSKSNNRVEEFDSGGTYLRTFGSSTGNQVSNPVGIAVDKSNNLYVTDNVQSNPGIVKFDSSGNFVSRVITSNGKGPDNATSLINPAKLAVDGSGNMYVLDSGYIKEYKSDGTFSSVSGQNIHFGAIMTIDSSDNVYSLRGTPAYGPVIGAREGSYSDTRISMVNSDISVVPEFGLLPIAVLATSIVAVIFVARVSVRGRFPGFP